MAKTLDHQSVGDDRCDKDRETEEDIVGGGRKRKMFSEEGGGLAKFYCPVAVQTGVCVNDRVAILTVWSHRTIKMIFDTLV